MQIDAVSSAPMMNAYSAAKSKSGSDFAKQLEDATQTATKKKDEAKLKSACKDFETMFLNLMYTKMRETVPDNTLFGDSNGEKIMQSMLDTELTKNMASAGGIGLADMLYRQLSMQKK